ncbi:hypothetical protein DENSPDRAFT_838243 [Dentipellis sp. KUC8613]|nr:hypothetical protein DENSPDRAFT_838243 [Dentipellis sp. KUC8613]
MVCQWRMVCYRGESLGVLESLRHREQGNRSQHRRLTRPLSVVFLNKCHQCGASLDRRPLAVKIQAASGAQDVESEVLALANLECKLSRLPVHACSIAFGPDLSPWPFGVAAQVQNSGRKLCGALAVLDWPRWSAPKLRVRDGVRIGEKKERPEKRLERCVGAPLARTKLRDELSIDVEAGGTRFYL